MARVLVVVASRHGATWETGEWLCGALRDGGLEAELARPVPAADPRLYDGVVLGSPMYAKRWLGDANAWAAHYRDALPRLPTWVFDSGMAPRSVADDVPLGDATRAVGLLGPLGYRHFGGRIDRALLSRAERAIVGALRKPDDDGRCRADVEAWAGEIGRDLTGALGQRVTAGAQGVGVRE